MTRIKAFTEADKKMPFDDMSPPRILIIIPTLRNELENDTLESIKKQTVPVTKILILNQAITERLPFPAKISKVLNDGLAKVNLSEYDYILRVDADVTLPKNFLEINLQAEPDVMGIGYAQIIKVAPFQRVMKGRFHVDQDDVYHRIKMALMGYRNMEYVEEPILKRKSGIHHGYHYFIERGEMLYRLGMDPIHVLAVSFLNRFYLFCALGYIKGMFQRQNRFDIAYYVEWQGFQKYKHPKSLMQLVKLLVRRLSTHQLFSARSSK